MKSRVTKQSVCVRVVSAFALALTAAAPAYSAEPTWLSACKRIESESISEFECPAIRVSVMRLDPSPTVIKDGLGAIEQTFSSLGTIKTRRPLPDVDGFHQAIGVSGQTLNIFIGTTSSPSPRIVHCMGSYDPSLDGDDACIQALKWFVNQPQSAWPRITSRKGHNPILDKVVTSVPEYCKREYDINALTMTCEDGYLRAFASVRGSDATVMRKSYVHDIHRVMTRKGLTPSDPKEVKCEVRGKPSTCTILSARYDGNDYIALSGQWMQDDIPVAAMCEMSFGFPPRICSEVFGNLETLVAAQLRAHQTK